MENSQYKTNIEHRLSVIETQISELINNHIKHLQERVDKIQWLLITNLIALVFFLAQELIK